MSGKLLMNETHVVMNVYGASNNLTVMKWKIIFPRIITGQSRLPNSFDLKYHFWGPCVHEKLITS